MIRVSHFKSILIKITQYLSILCLQSNLEGILNFQFQILFKKIGDKNHRFNHMGMI
jgi:hypothetical protein